MATALVKATPAAMRRSVFGRDVGWDDNLLPLIRGVPYRINMSAAPSTSTVSLITMTVVDYLGVAVPNVFNFDWWLSDDTDGQGLTATTASGAVGASSGTDLVVYTSKKATRSQTLKTGIYIGSITDTARTAFVVCSQLIHRAGAVPGLTLATASYG